MASRLSVSLGVLEMMKPQELHSVSDHNSGSAGHFSIKFHTGGRCSSVRHVLRCSEITDRLQFWTINRVNTTDLLAVLAFPDLLWYLLF
jgi:hypothetical protein